MVNAQSHFKLAGCGRCCRVSGMMLAPEAFPDCDYTAPEALQRECEHSEMLPGDVFSLALVGCELAANPINLPSDGGAWQQLRSGHLCESLLSALLSEPLLTLLRCMLCPTPGNRPTCTKISQRAGDLQCEALVEPSHECQKSELREALRKAEKVEEKSRQRAEAIMRELETVKRRQLEAQTHGMSNSSSFLQCTRDCKSGQRAAKRASSHHCK